MGYKHKKPKKDDHHIVVESKKSSNAILGGGDIAFPLFFSHHFSPWLSPFFTDFTPD